MTAAYNFPEEGLKHIQWRNAHTVSKFFYTFKMIHSYFVDQLQDINKVMIMIMRIILVMKMVIKLMMMTRQHVGRGLQVLYCTVVCCTVLYCTLLYFTLLYLYCTVLYCTVQHCTD